MQMIRLNITILVIIFIYFLHILSSRSVMESKDMSEPPREKIWCFSKKKNQSFKLSAKNSCRVKHKREHLPPTEKKNQTISGNFGRWRAETPVCEVNTSLKKQSASAQRAGSYSAVTPHQNSAEWKGTGKRNQPIAGVRAPAPPPPPALASTRASPPP